MTTSAPGKLMLFGEHAVVYGYPCIVTAIDRRLFVRPGKPEGDTRFMDAAVAAWGKGNERYTTQSAFSGTYGFGSSSAVTVAMLKVLRPQATRRQIFETAYKIVLDIQNTGSGFDVAAATYGGTLYYVKDSIIEPLSIKDMPLVVGYTGTKADTVSLIARVAQKKNDNPQKVHRIFQAIGNLVDQAKVELTEGDWERVGTLMNVNQEYLRDLGVSSQQLELFIRAAKGAGAYGAKLSGAGGGDCMIAIAQKDKLDAVKKAIQGAGGEVVDITPHAEGVRVER